MSEGGEKHEGRAAPLRAEIEEDDKKKREKNPATTTPKGGHSASRGKSVVATSNKELGSNIKVDPSDSLGQSSAPEDRDVVVSDAAAAASSNSGKMGEQLKAEAGDLSSTLHKENDADLSSKSPASESLSIAVAASSESGECGKKSKTEPSESSSTSEKKFSLKKNPSSESEEDSQEPPPVLSPNVQDVLFGRGGFTNSHIGNRRFRDIIALHRDDYVRAIKVKKPDVSRRIVKAIRTGNPPGRFLRRDHNDGLWHHVSDNVAKEKTSQALREKAREDKKCPDATAKKRSRDPKTLVPRYLGPSTVETAATELLQRQSKMAGKNGHNVYPQRMPDSKIVSPSDTTVASTVGKRKRSDEDATASWQSKLNLDPYRIDPYRTVISTSAPEGVMVPPMPAPPSAPDKKKRINAEESYFHVPENAVLGHVDAEGKIVLQDGDVLFGRGGMTNHHPGNVRFRELVAYHRDDYLAASKNDKPVISKVLVVAMRKASPPSRFLKRNANDEWRDVGDKRASEKVSQALRERWNPKVGEVGENIRNGEASAI